MKNVYMIGVQRVVLAGLLAGVAAGSAGCVERKLTIASDPPGALAWVNDVEVGHTPVTIPFQWYGDYDVRLRLDRMETPTTGPTTQPVTVQYELHTHRRAYAPWYQWLGVDLFAEMIPVDFKDEKVWGFNVPAVPQESDEELARNAKALQAQLSTPIALERNKPLPSLTPTTGPASVPAGK